MRTLQRYGLMCASFAVFLLITSCVSTSAAEKGDAARGSHRVAEKTDKDVLLIFTGSDWSTEATSFSKTVLTEAFKTSIAQNYTVRYIDLLRNPREQDREAAQKNYLLFSEYAVPDVPFVVLQTASQDMYASAVIEADITTDTALIGKIKALAMQRTAVVEARDLITTLQGVEKARAIDAFLNIVGNAESHRYDSLRMQVPALDPDNQSGLKSKYVLISADIRAKGFAQQGDYHKAGDEYRMTAETGGLDSGELQLAWYLTAYAYLMAGNEKPQTIIEYLQNAIAADPQSEATQQIEQAIKKLEKEMQ